MKRAAYIVLACIIGLCLLPVLAPFAAYTIASLAGCQLDEGSIHPCTAFGTDIGGALYTTAMFGWLGLATLPFAALAALLISLLALSDLIRYLWRRTRHR